MAVSFVAQSLGTKYLLDPKALAQIRDLLAVDGLVVYPTDTVYGLAADPFRPAAVDRLYAVKARPRDQPISIAVGAVADVFRYGEKTPTADLFVTKNLPGPFTMLLRATKAAPAPIVSNEGRIALRVPDHPIALLIAKSYGPITATSANLHGRPAPVTCTEARDQLGDRVDAYVDGGPTPLAGESTIVDLSGARAKVLRPGVLPRR